MDMRPPFKKTKGIEHLLMAATYSFGGFRRVMAEPAFRHELLFFAGGLVVFAIAGATAVEFVLLTLIFLVLFAFEAINTAIEELVDRVSPEHSAMGKHAKDLGSFAVFCLLVAAGLYMAFVVIF